MIIAALGPKGTYSHMAAMKYSKNAKIIFCEYISDAFELARQKKADMAIVPIENSLNGSVYETLDALYSNELRIISELTIPINHCLLSKTKNYKKIISHPQAIGQCLKFLKTKKGIETINSSSTANAAMQASEDKSLAAIGNELMAKIYGLKIIKKNISDSNLNQTKFLAISKNPKTHPKKEKCKTYMALFTKKDRPGLLFDILSVFRLLNINLTKIESRPSKKKMGQYIFYIEFAGRTDDEEIKKAINHLKKIVSEAKIFGSYNEIK